LVTVIVCPALAVPIPVPGNVTDTGFKLSDGGVKPVPEAATRTAGTPRLVLEITTVPF
jgi:hypothetical protein